MSKSRFEIEEWCRKFLERVFENAQPATELTKKLIKEEIDEDAYQRQMLDLLSDAKTYTDYSKELADFIIDLAGESK